MAQQADNNVIETVVQPACENGTPHMGYAVRLMLNEAMRLERHRINTSIDNRFVIKVNNDPVH